MLKEIRRVMKLLSLRELFCDKIKDGYSLKFYDWDNEKVEVLKGYLEYKGYKCKMKVRYCRYVECIGIGIGIGIIIKEK